MKIKDIPRAIGNIDVPFVWLRKFFTWSNKHKMPIIVSCVIGGVGVSSYYTTRYIHYSGNHAYVMCEKQSDDPLVKALRQYSSINTDAYCRNLADECIKKSNVPSMIPYLIIDNGNCNNMEVADCKKDCEPRFPWLTHDDNSIDRCKTECDNWNK